MKKITDILPAVLFFVIVAGIFVYSGNLNQREEKIDPDVITEATTARYKTEEILEYKGIRLDPSVGPNDNSIKGIQTVDIGSYNLEINGLVEQNVSLAYDQVLEMEAHRRMTTLYCVDGWEATILWQGVRISELIGLARPLKNAVTVIFHCVDGYTTSMPLDIVLERDMLLAYSSNGIVLPAALGYPFIVVAEDKLGYKWARWVNGIELSNDRDHAGYWEKLGYSNDAEVRKP